ncbi:3-dehydroquinate dehydratase [candidate division MSBL1 archaeon SCGC-AAA382A13]|uniref:3-dehydroquinate dehydratase n=1 Tax=candidate division MSBL1 archaeon SCGC-AAA382A13 TaxID=1698279 RepID=A0A133VFU5_9EURY|nr:3-dehydroquinate dehydratase [candidate division MSBL1 archaeon SCGC-AAA382A13]
MISIHDLWKDYNSKTALRGIDLEIEEGEIFGLLGPNGSGKSTLMRTILGITKPTKGKVRVNNVDPSESETEVKKMVGYVPESPHLYESLSPREFFEFIGSVRGVPTDSLERVERLIDAFEIKDEVNNDIGSLSFGMRQKVSIIAALIHNPKVLILDECMNGLDPKSVRVLKEFLNSFSERKGTVVYSTHVLEVAEKMCDRVAILRKGNVEAVGSVEELREILKSQSLEDVFFKVTEEEDFEPIIRALEETL